MVKGAIMPEVSGKFETSRLWKPFRRGDLIAIFLIAIFLRLAFFAASNDQIGTSQVLEKCFDCNLYIQMAKSVAYDGPDYENGFFYFGPGYAYFLAANVKLLQSRVVPIIIVNIIISSLSCLLIYSLGMKLLRSYSVAIIAALLAATSYTSITLSCVTLSDTLYFFIFLSALLLFLTALDSGTWRHFLAAGIAFGVGTLVRPIGQYSPLLMLVIAAISLPGRVRRNPGSKIPAKAVALRAMVAIIITFAITSSWMIRNYKVNGVMTMAITSANGPANLAAVTIERLDGTYSKDVMQKWAEKRLAELDKPQLTLGEQFTLYRERSRAITDSLTWHVAVTYFSLLWENLNEISYWHRALIPRCDSFTIPLEKMIKDYYLNYVNFVLSMLGLVILWWQHKYRIAIILGSIYGYYAVTIGFFRWQGSRYFFPGQTAWAILIAVSLIFIATQVWKLVGRLRHRSSTPV